MNREQTRKEALEFLGDELCLCALRRRDQQTCWSEANKKSGAASTDIKAWQLWRHARQLIAVWKMSLADKELHKIALREMSIRRAMVTLNGGYAPDEMVLDVFQQIANEALMAQVRLAGVGAESDKINARSETAHQLVEELRREYRAAYCRAA